MKATEVRFSIRLQLLNHIAEHHDGSPRNGCPSHRHGPLKCSMMTSSNGSIFRVTCLVCWNSPVAGVFPAQRPVTRSVDVFLISAWTDSWANNGGAGDLRRYHAHYDVIVMQHHCINDFANVIEIRGLLRLAFTQILTKSMLQMFVHDTTAVLDRQRWARCTKSLQWRHNHRDDVSNHQPRGCLLNRLFRRRSKKTWKLRVTGLCEEIHRWPVNSPHKGPVTRVTRKMFEFDNVIMGV